MQDNIETTGSEMPMTAEELTEKHKLSVANTSALDAVLQALTADAYGDFSPDEGGAPFRRPFGVELLAKLRAVIKAARDFANAALGSYTGADELAIFDFARDQHRSDLYGAIYTLVGVVERDKPIQPGPNLANTTLRILAGEWTGPSVTVSSAEFRNFVTDSLRGRRVFCPDLIDRELTKLFKRDPT